MTTEWLYVCIAAEFSTYLRYTRQLDFFETPDYDYARGLFTGLMAANGWQCDWEFDWTSRHAVCNYFILIVSSLAFHSVINNNNEYICKAQFKQSSNALLLDYRAGVKSFHLLQECLDGGRQSELCW